MRFSIPVWLKNHTQPRNGSRAHLALFAGGGVAAMVFLGALVTNFAHHETVKAPLGAGAGAATEPVQQVSTFASPTGRAVAQATPVVDTRATAQTGPAVPAAAVADAAPQNLPPAGLVAGHVRESVAVQDQFGQFTQAAARVVGAPATSWQSHVAASGSPAWKETFVGWIRLAAPATIAELRVGAGGAARAVSAQVDGASLGAPLGYGPASETAALSLPAGWHSFIVTAEGGRLNYSPPATPIELLIGNGTDTPMPVVPYAAAPQPAVAGHVAAAAPVKSASQAPAQPATKAASSAVTPAAPTVPAKASTVGAAKEH